MFYIFGEFIIVSVFYQFKVVTFQEHSLHIASSVLLRLKLLSVLSDVQFASIRILVNILLILADLLCCFL